MKLREWLDQECIEIKQLAGKMEISRHTIHLWLSGKVMPLRIHRALLQKITKNQVTLGDWDEQGKVDRRKRSSKDNGMPRTQRMGNDKKAKPKGRKAAR